MIGSVTVKDVARKADVSIGTVSRVFNNHANVTEEIRHRVLRAAEEIGYVRTNRPVSSLPSQPLKEIGFLLAFQSGASRTNPFWSLVLAGAEREAQRHSIKIAYRAIGELLDTPQQLTAVLQEMQLGGMLLIGPTQRDTIQLIQNLNIPIVLVDNHIPGLAVDSVLCDNFEGARLAVRHLIDHGHRRIAYIGGPASAGARPTDATYTLERRRAGYLNALFDAGLEIHSELIEYHHFADENSTHQACQRLLAKGMPFSALFCTNDETAIEAIKSLRAAGLRVPEDVSVVGFDDIAMVEHLTPALTTVRMDKEAMGEIAVRRLLQRYQHPNSTVLTSTLDVELIKRASVVPFLP